MFRLALIYLCCIASPAVALSSERTQALGNFCYGDRGVGRRRKVVQSSHIRVQATSPYRQGTGGGELRFGWWSLLGGIRLGYAMRKLGVHANVKPDQTCIVRLCPCILGRTAENRGRKVMASTPPASIRNANKAIEDDELDSIQYLGAITNAYVTEMTGKSDVALKALSTSAATIAVLSDPELVSMGVITIATRPSQYGSPGFKCPRKRSFPSSWRSVPTSTSQHSTRN